nr:pro-neuregulin-4, membrane-bound isoform isoform X1 [Arvicanthis niloticus]
MCCQGSAEIGTCVYCWSQRALKTSPVTGIITYKDRLWTIQQEKALSFVNRCSLYKQCSLPTLRRCKLNKRSQALYQHLRYSILRVCICIQIYSRVSCTSPAYEWELGFWCFKNQLQGGEVAEKHSRT